MELYICLSKTVRTLALLCEVKNAKLVPVSDSANYFTSFYYGRTGSRWLEGVHSFGFTCIEWNFYIEIQSVHCPLRSRDFHASCLVLSNKRKTVQTGSLHLTNRLSEFRICCNLSQLINWTPIKWTDMWLRGYKKTQSNNRSPEQVTERTMSNARDRKSVV